MSKVIEYPSWHDDARRAYKSGKKSRAQIADEFGFPVSRVSHILGPSWKVYLYVYRHSYNQRPDVKIAKSDIDKGLITFKPVQTPSPKELEAATKAARPTHRPRPQEEDPMAKLRTFPEVKDFREGKILKGAKISCYKCGATETYMNFQGSVSTEHLPKEFTRKGWLVGKNDRTDTCPSCVAALRGAKTKPKIEEDEMSVQPNFPISPVIPVPIETVSVPDILTEVKPAPVIERVVEPVVAKLAKPIDIGRDMDRTDRRLVFSRLNELYQDEETGYSGDWTDAKVAADMGVPIEWVKEVRDAQFGPELNASIRAKSFTDMQKLGETIERHILLVDKKIEQMQSLDAKISDQMKLCNEAIDRFEELAKSLETEDKRVEGILEAFNKDVSEFKKLFADLAGLASPK